MNDSANPDAVVLIRGDGTIGAVRGMPSTWIDRRVDELPLAEGTEMGAAPLLPRASAAGLSHAVDFASEDDSFVFVVSDNGPGMPESTAKWLFERDPHTGKAVGLGLLMIKDVAAAHGGSIAVTSRLGHGAEFRLRVPRGERLGHSTSSRAGD